jgi:hypothetical protein
MVFSFGVAQQFWTVYRAVPMKPNAMIANQQTSFEVRNGGELVISDEWRHSNHDVALEVNPMVRMNFQLNPEPVILQETLRVHSI